MKDCNRMFPPSTNSDCSPCAYKYSMICGNIFCRKSMGMYSMLDCGECGFSVNTSVRTFPSNKCSSGESFCFLSITIRTGDRPCQLRTVRPGLSSSAVRVPTIMALCSARFLCTSMEVNGLDKITGFPPSRKLSMYLSADSAHFSVIYGRCKV